MLRIGHDDSDTIPEKSSRRNGPRARTGCSPDYGRPTTTQKPLDVQDRVSLSSLATSRSAEPAPVTYKNTKEGAKARAVEDLAEKFFNPKSVAGDEGTTKSEEILKRMEENKSFSNVNTTKMQNLAEEDHPIAPL